MESLQTKVRIITPAELKEMRYPLPESWTKAIGLLKGKKVTPLRYQKHIRRGWGKRLKRQTALTLHGY